MCISNFMIHKYLLGVLLSVDDLGERGVHFGGKRTVFEP